MYTILNNNGLLTQIRQCNATLATIITNLLAAPGSISVSQGVNIGEGVTTIAQLCDFLEDAIAEGAIDQTTLGLGIAITAILESGSHPVVTNESLNTLIECLLDVDFS